MSDDAAGSTRPLHGAFARHDRGAGTASSPLAQPRRGLRVTVCDGRGRAVRVPGLAAWLSAIAPARARGREVTIAIVSDRAIRGLNRAYRDTDRVTDVLSFPVARRAAGAGRQDTRRGDRERDAVDAAALGDIVIGRGAAFRQARAAGHGLGIELRILALHGLLHLLGYDHDRDEGRMAKVERRLRRTGGLPEGLIERGRG